MPTQEAARLALVASGEGDKTPSASEVSEVWTAWALATLALAGRMVALVVAIGNRRHEQKRTDGPGALYQ